VSPFPIKEIFKSFFQIKDYFLFLQKHASISTVNIGSINICKFFKIKLIKKLIRFHLFYINKLCFGARAFILGDIESENRNKNCNNLCSIFIVLHVSASNLFLRNKTPFYFYYVYAY